MSSGDYDSNLRNRFILDTFFESLSCVQVCNGRGKLTFRRQEAEVNGVGEARPFVRARVRKEDRSV